MRSGRWRFPNGWWALTLGTTLALGVWALNYWSVSANDELSFAFGGQCSDGFAPIDHIASFGDILRQQVRDYSYSISCRVITNALCAVIGLYDAYTVFDVINTAVWVLFVTLVWLETGRRSWLWTFAVVFWFVWESETCSKTTIHAMNYLWAAAFAVGIVRWWREGRSAWTIPLFGVFGAWSEALSVPMIAALGGSWVLNRKARGGWIRLLQFVSLACGAAFIVLGPSLRNRAGRELVDSGAVYFLIEKAKLAIRLALHPPFVLLVGLLVALLVLAWCRRRAVIRDEWALLALFGLLFYAVVGITGTYRVSMAFLLGATVVVLRELGDVGPKVRLAAIAFVTVWLGICAVLQVRLGTDYRAMLARYAEDPQGITYLPVRHVLPFQRTCTVDDSHRWHFHFHQLMAGHPHPMAILSPRMYEELYLTGTQDVEVVRHNAVPPAWRHFLESYFPPEDAAVSLPAKDFSFVSQKGAKIVIRSDVRDR